MYRDLFDSMLHVGPSDMHMTWAPNDITNDFNKDKKGQSMWFFNFKNDLISNKYYF